MANYIWLEFANGQYLAHLKAKRIEAVEVATGIGLGEMYPLVMAGIVFYKNDDGGSEVYYDLREARWKAKHLEELVRQAFIGGAKCIVNGDKKDIEAYEINQAMMLYLNDRPLTDLWKLAAAILQATMEGYEPGEAEGVKAPSQVAENEASLDLTDTPAI